MFTIKLYGDLGHRQRILEAESFTILRVSDGFEVTLHRPPSMAHDDCRYDIKNAWPEPKTSDEQQGQWPARFDRAIIENAAGKTTEIVSIFDFAAANKMPIAA